MARSFFIAGPPQDEKPLSQRRFMDLIAASLDEGLRWVVFEPNGPALWARIRQALEDFLLAQWNDGALQGSRPEEACFVRAAP